MNKLMMVAGGARTSLAACDFLGRAMEADLQGKVALITGGFRG